MSISGLLRTTTFGTCLLLAGCADEIGGAGGDAEAAPPPGDLGWLLDPTGTGSTNGLPPSDFHPSAFALNMATTQPLLDGAPVADLDAKAPSPLGLTAKLNPAVASLFTTPAARHTFKYAMQCALPIGTSVELDGVEYQGGGVLSTSSGWATGSLGPDPKSDLFACMAAHLNVVGAEVDLRLSGSPIANLAQEAEVSGFKFQEAYWLANAGTGLTVTYQVWPLPDLDALCGGSVTSEALNLRVCGTVNGGCGLQVRTDLAADCAEGPTGPTCLGRPVIKTWLRADDAPLMHPRCVRRPRGAN